MQMSSSYGFLFIFIIMFLLGLHGVINPKGVKKENVDVPVSPRRDSPGCRYRAGDWWKSHSSQYLDRSEEHTSELQSHLNLVCRLLLEKKTRTIRLILSVRLTPTASFGCNPSPHSSRIAAVGD